MLEGIQVLDLGLGAERHRAGRPDRNVRIAAEAPLLHVAVVDTNGDEDLAQPAEELTRVGSRPQVRLGDDLEEGHATAIEVQVGAAIRISKTLVQRFPGVLFEVRSRNPNAPRRAGHLILDAAAGRNGPLVLRDLVPLWKVRIEVVLPREDGDRIHAAVQGMRDPDGQFHGPAIQHRQRPRKPEADGADVGVRRRPEPGAAAAEDLRLRQQLGMNLETDHGLERFQSLGAEC